MAGRINPNTGKRPSGTGTVASERNTAAQNVATINKKIQDLTYEETTLQRAIKSIDENIKIQENIIRTSTSPTAVATAIALKEELKKERITKAAKLKTTSSDLLAAKTQLNVLISNSVKPLGNYQMSTGSSLTQSTKKPDSSNTDATAATDAKTPGPALRWKYNPPMVKAAYLSPVGLQKQDGYMPVGDPGTWNDALDAWKLSGGSKGVIQMSRSYPYYFSKVTNGKAKLITEDSVVYGFRFLYNPTTVAMSWGVGTEVDIAKFAAGSFRAAPITDAAMNSSVTFSIILNRMLDMNHLTEDGAIIGNPYLYTLSRKDAQGIYKRGTMWDLEYLFKAVNGKNVEYNSNLNENTADLGWLNSFPVELHLGSGLRYLVRVTQMSVDHKIFNERMVPIFSQVDFICKRLPDLPATDDYRNTSGGGGRGPNVQ